MLPQLDKYSPILLEHLEGADGASLVACFQEPIALFFIFDRLALAEGGAVAADS